MTMNIPIVVTVGFCIALFCLTEFVKKIKKARSNLSDQGLRTLENLPDESFFGLLISISPMLASYFVQDYFPFHPLIIISIATVLTVFLILKKQIKLLRNVEDKGVSSSYRLEFIKAQLVLWLGVVVFATTYILTELGWVS